MISPQLAAGVYLYKLPPLSSSMKYMLPAPSNWMPSCDVRGITFWWTNSAPSLLVSVSGSVIAGAVIGFLSSNRRPYGLMVHPAAPEHHDSSAVMYVPHGVQYEASNAT